MNESLVKLKRLLRYRDPAINRLLHPSARVCRKTEFDSPVSIGPDCRVRRSHIGRFTYLSRGILLNGARLGPYCSIGPEAIIGGLGRHPVDHFSTSPVTFSPGHPLSRLFGSAGFDLGFEEELEVTIGADVWIGARAMIADGVTIGRGAVIGANTFISKDVPPYAVVLGSPPRVARIRFPEEVIRELDATKWWEKAPDDLDAESLVRICRAQH